MEASTLVKSVLRQGNHTDGGAESAQMVALSTKGSGGMGNATAKEG